MSITKFVEGIFADASNFPEGGLTQKEIVHKILKYRNKPINHDTEKKEQPNASKALAKLLRDERIYVADDHTYHPKTQETAQKEALVEFSQNIYCLKDDIFAISDTMILIKVHSDYVNAATDYLRKYIGEDRYFDIFYSNSYLWVLWATETEDGAEFRAVYDEIKEAVEISYYRYIDSLKKKKKLTKD